MLDRFTGMEVFARVAAQGSFSAAARSLGLSPTMVTKHVDAIEQRLGARLLFRSTRRLALTEAGRAYLDTCARVLAEIEEMEAALSASGHDISGTLKINAPVSFGARQLTPLIGEFLALHPLIRVELGLNDRTVDLIDEGWDMAIRIGELADDRLTALKLAPCRTVLCAAPSYLAAHGRPRTVADLAGHHCLDYTLARAGKPGQWRFGAKGEVTTAVSGPFRSNNGDSLLAAATAGLGIIYQPTFIVADALERGSVVALPLDLPCAELSGIFALHAHDRRVPAKVRAMIDFLARRLGPRPPWDEAPSNKPLTGSGSAPSNPSLVRTDHIDTNELDERQPQS